VIGEQLANSEFVDEASRRRAIEQAQAIDDAARQRGLGDRAESATAREKPAGDRE
jgi:hypothetical protein